MWLSREFRREVKGIYSGQNEDDYGLEVLMKVPCLCQVPNLRHFIFYTLGSFFLGGRGDLERAKVLGVVILRENIRLTSFAKTYLTFEPMDQSSSVIPFWKPQNVSSKIGLIWRLNLQYSMSWRWV